MEEDKNIRLTVVRQEEETDEVTIDLSTAWNYCKRLFTVWLAASVAVGAIIGGLGFLLRDLMPAEGAHAVISFSSGGGELNLDSLDVQRITSSNVVADAMDSLGLPLDDSDTIRTNLTIEGIVPDSVQDQRTLFYKIFSDTSGSSSAGMNAAEKLLDTNYTSTRYVLTFDYRKAGYSRADGIAILNAVIESYRNYFMETYTKRPLLGSLTNVIDYRDYEFAEAIDIFDSSLTSIASFLNEYSSSFRSSSTGYTVADLLRQTESIQNVEMARLVAFVTQHCVCRGSPEDVIARYQWRMEENNRLWSVQKTRLDALTTTADSYQKDPLLYVVGASGTLKGPGGELNGVYDDLVRDILSTQSEISRLVEKNRFYQSVIDRFVENSEAGAENAQRADREMEALNQKIKDLVDVINLTMSDYFDMSLSSLFLVQMPSVAEAPRTLSPALLKTIVLAEGVLFIACLGVVFFQTVWAANREAQEKKNAAASAEKERK